MLPTKDPKEVAGVFAANFVTNGMVVGLGTGSTARFAIQHLGTRVHQGLQISGIPTSEASAQQAAALGIPLVGFEQVEQIDLTIDGADEIDANFCMVKGGGGALLREKVVASITKRQIAIVDPLKVVETLGTFPLPVEVVPFGWPVVARRIEALGGQPALRRTNAGSGQPYVTDNHNYILDCHFYPIQNPPQLEQTLLLFPGVVEVGLFINLAHTLIIGKPDGTCEIRERP